MFGILAGALFLGASYVVWQFCCRGSSVPPEVAAASAQTLQTVRQVHYDSGNPSHEALLQRLWKALHKGEEYPARKGGHWEALGFQGRDPATDFRGGGVLSLLHLVFVAERYPEEVRQLLEDSEYTAERAETREWYMWAVTGINITGMLCAWVKEGRLSAHFAHCPPVPIDPSEAAGDAEQLLLTPVVAASCRLYASMVLGFHKRWLVDRPDVMQMQQYITTAMPAPESLSRL
eukprot:Hpha_TRINITY_DN10817_c0_g2::TRINITY_DN10817_c0_g2_i1::g.23296::m.23296